MRHSVSADLHRRADHKALNDEMLESKRPGRNPGRLTIALDYSLLTPYFSMTGRHLAISAVMSLSRS
jgi:hypothetical protein